MYYLENETNTTEITKNNWTKIVPVIAIVIILLLIARK
jgi:hypothetical protein